MFSDQRLAGMSETSNMFSDTTSALVAPASFSVFSGISDRKSEPGLSAVKGRNADQEYFSVYSDGPSSPLFRPLTFEGNMEMTGINSAMVSGTRADSDAFKRMKMVLTSAHRNIHNQMHAMGYFHQHTATNNHPGHLAK